MNGKIIQLIPAPEKILGNHGSLIPSGLLCLGLTNDGEIVFITHSSGIAGHWANQTLKIIRPYTSFERNDDY